MTKSGDKFPLHTSRPQELDPALLTIPLQENLEFNTHNTFGEHALKESGTWTEFLRGLKTQGRVPSVEDPFSYYLQNGPGRFYRAYMTPGDPMAAGMTISPNERGGYKVDNTYSIDQTAITAAAYHKILTRKFFDEFCGVPSLGRASNLDIPIEIVRRDTGLARAVFDFGLVNGEKLVIPMPGIAPFPMEDKSDEEKQKVRDTIESREITGIFPHLSQEDATYVTTNEYYRRGIHVGTLIKKSVTIKGLYVPERTSEVIDVDGQAVELRISNLRDTAQHAHVLKKLAEKNKNLAELILG